MIPSQKQSIRTRSVWMFLAAFILMGCSQGILVKNWLRVPVEIHTLQALDSLGRSPRYVTFTGNSVNTLRILDEDIQLVGRRDTRPVWSADERGCLVVEKQARVRISDFNFHGRTPSQPLIRVRSGHLVLENCDLRSAESLAILVEPDGSLELRDVHFLAGAAGAIQVNGGQVKIYDGSLTQVSRTALQVNGARLVEIHATSFQNTMGTAIEVDSTMEVWLDSVLIEDSFQDGLRLEACDYVLLDQVVSRKNGRHGLSISQVKLCGIIDFASLGNLVSGMEIMNVDTLRMVNTELVGNGETGAVISRSPNMALGGMRVGHNGGVGLDILHVENLSLGRSSFQAHPQYGLKIDSTRVIKLDQISIVNNEWGLDVSHFDSLDVEQSLFSGNRNKAMMARNGKRFIALKNLVKNNRIGFELDSTLLLKLDSNHIEANDLGLEFREVSTILATANKFLANKSAAYYMGVSNFQSDGDHWADNLDLGLEIHAAGDVIISDGRFKNNRKAASFNEVSLLMSACHVDSNREVGINLNRGTLTLENSRISSNGTGVRLGEGSRGKINQSKFIHNGIALTAEASVDLKLTFSEFRLNEQSIRLGNYIDASIVSSLFEGTTGSAIDLTGPHARSLLLRQNVMAKNAGVLSSNAQSGEILIQNNTFSENTGGLKGRSRSLASIEHNIFFHTAIPATDLLKDPTRFAWNCVYPAPAGAGGTEIKAPNLIADPGLTSQFYLAPHSPCLKGGDNGMQIGARGPVPVTRPRLNP